MDFDDGETGIQEVMTRPVQTIDKDSTVQEASFLLRKHNISGLVVVDNKTKKAEGMITDKDIITKVVAENKSARDVKVADVMSPNIITASFEDSLSSVAKIMYANGVTRLPVMDSEGGLVGILTSTDLLRVLPGLTDILHAKREIDDPPQIVEHPGADGRCEECDNMYEDLVEVGGRWLCRECSEKYTEVGTKKREF
ncbi:MAG: CBS domain-containing protein [Candidatus Aenigmarchaeota archaeon]|nr:CBS domain-containing protein [Candidatus Aenigmarchaeota archaeon]